MKVAPNTQKNASTSSSSLVGSEKLIPSTQQSISPPFAYSINTALFPNIPINIEELKKDRQKLIKKIQNTF